MQKIQVILCREVCSMRHKFVIRNYQRIQQNVDYNFVKIIIPDPTSTSGFPSVTAEVKSAPRYSMSHCQFTNLCCWVCNTQKAEEKLRLQCQWHLTAEQKTTKDNIWKASPSTSLHTWMAILERTAVVSWWMIWAFRLPVLSISPTMTGNDYGAQNTFSSAFKSCG